MKRTIIGLLALTFIVTGYKTQPNKEEFVDSLTETAVKEYNKENVHIEDILTRLGDVEPKDFIESCIDQSIVVRSFLLLDVAKLPDGTGLGTVAIGAFGKVWTFGQKVVDQVIPMMTEPIEQMLQNQVEIKTK